MVDLVVAAATRASQRTARRPRYRPTSTGQPIAAKPEKPPKPVALIGSVVEIPVDKIHRRPSNRGGQAVEFPDVADLVESIELFGLSNPVQVREDSEDQELPVGHYELVKGERRWTAFRALHQDKIPAIVVAVDRRAASIQAGIDNTHARALDPIQRLLEIRHAVNHDGCTLEEAAQSRGITTKQAQGDLRLLDLPDDLQAAIAAGALSVSAARILAPYREIPALMKRVAKAVKDKEPWLKRDAEDVTLRSYLLRLVQEVTRPLDKTEYYGGYQVGTIRCEFAGRKDLTEERKQRVKALEVRIQNKPTLLATDVQAWETINAEVAAEKKQAEKAKDKKRADQLRKAGKSVNPEAEAKQDKSLEAEVAVWHAQFLRLAIASHLVPGDYRTRKVIAWVRQTAQDQCGHRLDETDWLSAVGELRGIATRKLEEWRMSWWDKLQLLLLPDNDDPISADEECLCLLTRLILWPVAPRELPRESFCGSTLAQPGQLPERLPGLDFNDLVKVSEYLAGPTIGPGPQPWPTRLADAWKRARAEGPEQAMLAQLLEIPNRRQLGKWVKDWSIDLDVSGKLDEVRADLLAHHVTFGLALPSWLQPAKKSRAKTR